MSVAADSGVCLVATTGDPAGIGPDLLVQIAMAGISVPLVVVGDPGVLKERSHLLGYNLEILEYVPTRPFMSAVSRQLIVLPVSVNKEVVVGRPNPHNAEYVLKVLDLAADLCFTGEFDGIVTAPICKSIINESGIAFCGHTEYLAEKFNCPTVMLLTCPELKVALVTTHIPLCKVSAQITSEWLQTVLEILQTEMIRCFQIINPTILVCGLNPHAGENGYLGDEETRVISPLIQTLRQKDFDIHGPVSADTAFGEANRRRFDVFVCMYHDQGLPVLKTLGFGKAVNVTLGLPIIRTSVDHGTAFELAGTGKSQPDSFLAAIESAEKLVSAKKAST